MTRGSLPPRGSKINDFNMKPILIILCIIPQITLAENPNKLFDATHNMTNKTTVEWIQTNNVQKICDEISIRKTNKKFGYAVESCASWDETNTGFTCTIYTEKKTSMATIGHEFRHCVQGDFHK